MVRTKGPMLSLEATGAFDGTVINQTWKGRSYMRKLTAPANPKAPKQVGVRAMFAFLTQHWMTLSAADQATWDPPATERNILPFNAYLQTNLLRHIENKAPGETYPVGETGLTPVITTHTATPQGRGLLVDLNIVVLNDNQGAKLHRNLTQPFTPILANLVAVIPTPSSGFVEFFDTPLQPDTYWYRWHVFTTGGKYKNPSSAFMGTVT